MSPIPLEEALEAVKDAVYAENATGGEARAIVARCAGILGLDLSDEDMLFHRWSPENMARVPVALRELAISTHTVTFAEPAPGYYDSTTDQPGIDVTALLDQYGRLWQRAVDTPTRWWGHALYASSSWGDALHWGCSFHEVRLPARPGVMDRG
ncbi:hypothetical protein RHODO2019_10750 [Rhodococcus antarcticus]|uniref:Uncharacterized protein n=1 Tax=Rhodococcus antarcticus TaxID=2987751 RepID=A0ABY6NWC7_9NOCA|nr:hypothetical protein [Rhodococcus antarcticus]UZJ23686.1 hypothetical protein RHODO2019_10750 [Rhodococcus antarcticus]